MDIETLKKKAHKAWFEYGEAIKETFGFDGNIIADPLIKVITTDDEDRITQFIDYAKERTAELKRICQQNKC
ncbi:MAG: hypothetical protein A2173_08615 [Planctomycetes bacterium RBG_13_44_8b]|nr:MAG: hypothetical protein A2173_08615 [Planctomycetes bacterium RBG_13_44_8b]